MVAPRDESTTQLDARVRIVTSRKPRTDRLPLPTALLFDFVLFVFQIRSLAPGGGVPPQTDHFERRPVPIRRGGGVAFNAGPGQKTLRLRVRPMSQKLNDTLQAVAVAGDVERCPLLTADGSVRVRPGEQEKAEGFQVTFLGGVMRGGYTLLVALLRV